MPLRSRISFIAVSGRRLLLPFLVAGRRLLPILELLEKQTLRVVRLPPFAVVGASKPPYRARRIRHHHERRGRHEGDVAVQLPRPVPLMEVGEMEFDSKEIAGGRVEKSRTFIVGTAYVGA